MHARARAHARTHAHARAHALSHTPCTHVAQVQSYAARLCERTKPRKVGVCMIYNLVRNARRSGGAAPPDVRIGRNVCVWGAI
jgi:hypothetical protein